MRRAILITIIAIGCIPATARAQAPQSRATHATPVWFGADVLFAVPVGAFKQHVGTAGGMNASFTVYPSRRRAVGLRVELSHLTYGTESRPASVNLVSALMLVSAKVETGHSILSASVGPAFAASLGFLRMHATGQVGFSRFSTNSSVYTSGLFGFSAGGSETKATFSSTRLMLGSGLGVSVPVRFDRVPGSIDLSARYLRHGRARYVTNGGIEEHPDGSISLRPTESAADLLHVRLGVSIGLPRQ